jgi:hypothetical protein
MPSEKRGPIIERLNQRGRSEFIAERERVRRLQVKGVAARITGQGSYTENPWGEAQHNSPFSFDPRLTNVSVNALSGPFTNDAGGWTSQQATPRLQ